MTDRPTFNLNNDSNYPVRAGGILFYYLNSKKETPMYELLLIKCNNKYEDFGGCTDIKDKSIIDTICREVEEESNKIFEKDFIKNKINDIKPVYIKICKYALYLVELDEYYNTTLFGDKEIHDNINRTVEWVTYDEFNSLVTDKKVNFRLNQYNILNQLKKVMIIL